MSGVVALRADAAGRGERVVTVCCGGHRPSPGEASTCLCCPECVTNAEVQRRTFTERAEHARLLRERYAPWRAAIASCRRWAYRTWVHEGIDAHVHPLDVATQHAAALPEPPMRPWLPELEAACPRTSPWFTQAVAS